MKNMTSNLALIVKQLLFCKSSVQQLCILTYICSLYAGERLMFQVFFFHSFL